MNHDSYCQCGACALARCHDATPETDRDSQRLMIDRWASIESILADEAGPTNHDRDTRDPQ